MSNPVMSALEKKSRAYTPAGYPTMPGYTPGGSAQSAPAPYPLEQTPGTVDVSAFERAYTQPAADAVDRGQVTFDDIIMRTATLFGMLVTAGALTWYLLRAVPDFGVALTLGGMAIGFVLALVNSFKKEPSPVLISMYALAEGVFIGGLSSMVETIYPGIVVQAVLGTVSVFAVALILFKTGLVRVSGTFVRVLLVGMIGLLVYYAASVVLQITGVIEAPLGTVTVLGIPLGIIVGLLAVALAAMSLISDFSVAEECVAAGMPKKVAWMCAFGLIVTLVWLYLEILRLLQYVRMFSE